MALRRSFSHIEAKISCNYCGRVLSRVYPAIHSGVECSTQPFGAKSSNKNCIGQCIRHPNYRPQTSKAWRPCQMCCA
ncbi:hypothetical protein BJX70DRAFT_355560 [Aspergillus crustosus]